MNQILNAEVMSPATPKEVAAVALQEAMRVLDQSKTIVVASAEQYASADAAMSAIKAAKKQAEAKRVSITGPINDSLKLINAEFKRVDAAFEQALDHYRRPMTTFQQEQDRIRREAEAAAEKEHRRLEEEARVEAQKKIDEAHRLADEAKQAAQAAVSEDPFSALMAEEAAAEATAAAETASEEARQAIRQIATISVPVDAAPKVTGAASRNYTIWEYEITDEALVPMAYRPIDHASLSRDVKAGKSECQIPGVRVYSRQEVK
jgi:hypothetical protein